MTTDAPIRKSVPLTPDELALLDAARTDGTPTHEALTELLAANPALRELAATSESAILHALIQLGIGAVRERAMEHGYAALAAAQDDEDRAYHAAMRRRPRGTGE